MDREFLERNAFRFAHRDFYQVDVRNRSDKRGNFSNVARCRLSGTLLGPTNHHAYQPQLRKLVRATFQPPNEFSRLSAANRDRKRCRGSRALGKRKPKGDHLLQPLREQTSSDIFVRGGSGEPASPVALSPGARSDVEDVRLGGFFLLPHACSIARFSIRSGNSGSMSRR